MCVCLFICMMKTETHTGERDERGSCFVQFKFLTPHQLKKHSKKENIFINRLNLFFSLFF